ncbi:MAG: nucleotidyltransferase family protein, partial [Leptospiraceae bacterium]|nr:nucleotidyltransferase family protein [Leptospiraceae bacterium]
MTATGPQSQTNRSISPAMRHLIGLRADLRGVSQSNLEWLGDDPVLGFLAPVYGFAPVAPRNMARYVLLRSVLDRVLKVLDAANISVVLLKGLYYAEHLYPGPALRPTQDIDLLVSARDFARAVMALQTSGWKLLAGSPYAQSSLCNSAGQIELDAEFDPQSFLSPGEANFQDSTGVDIDLHWHISP